MPLNLVVMASGQGSNCKAILDAIRSGRLDATVHAVISNLEDAPVLALAQSAGIEAHAVPHRGKTREAHEQELLRIMSGYPIDYVVLAGYMRMLTPTFIQAFPGEGHYRIVNIHPALLPAFPGVNGYGDAFAYGVKVSGVTVHFVDELMDHGPIILQDTFPRMETDTLADFKARGLALEHQLYPQALQLLAENRLAFRYDSDSERTYVEIKAHAVY